ncbi:hypothetical protein FEM48_Zijuj12G0084900 [Ziziphus jujuba var. spinosa]|uniref:Legume lectin domain-containing protein n=1 Tax=Ziziphus jujuba var. spinosa TaxID=714518 RepID=A0A978UC88_ZIZJJ|nr:hypothetical protein FEM48_Zijuj12G0084900 [Ziziphus jujuba var. spinosa]
MGIEFLRAHSHTRSEFYFILSDSEARCYMCQQLVSAYNYLLLWFAAFTQVVCLTFNYPTFDEEVEEHLISKNSDATKGTIQFTPNVGGDSIENSSGRAFYGKPFKLWRKGKGNHSIFASFNSTFVINITPKTYPRGEGLAFVLTRNTTILENSKGKWLGIVNTNTNGSSQAKIVAIEFDTRKSYEEDIDDNHVSNITAQVQYDGKNISVFVSHTNETRELTKNLVLTMPINLSDFLPQKIYVGFSASTGIYAQLNTILAWEFHSTSIDGKSDLTWVWITVGVVVALGNASFLFLYWFHVLMLGLACCHPNPIQRPSMRAVLKVLAREADPPLISTDIPAFVWPPMPSFSDYTNTTLEGGILITEITGR